MQRCYTERKRDDDVGLGILCKLPDFVGAVDAQHPCFCNQRGVHFRGLT